MQYLTPIKGLKNVFAPLLRAKLLLHKRSRGEDGFGIRRGTGWLLEPMLEGSAGPGPHGTALTAGSVFADLFFEVQFYSFFSSGLIPEGDPRTLLGSPVADGRAVARLKVAIIAG